MAGPTTSTARSPHGRPRGTVLQSGLERSGAPDSGGALLRAGEAALSVGNERQSSLFAADPPRPVDALCADWRLRQEQEATTRYVRNATLLKEIFDELVDVPSLGDLSDRGAWLSWSLKHQQAVERGRAPRAPTPGDETASLDAGHEALLALTAQANAASDTHELMAHLRQFERLASEADTAEPAMSPRPGDAAAARGGSAHSDGDAQQQGVSSEDDHPHGGACNGAPQLQSVA